MKKLLSVYILYLVISQIIIYRFTSTHTIEIINFGPKQFSSLDTKDKNINTIWITTKKPVPESSYLLFGKHKIELTISQKDSVVSASIGSELMKKTGSYVTQIVSPSTNETSNKIEILVLQ